MTVLIGTVEASILSSAEKKKIIKTLSEKEKLRVFATTRHTT